jgi:single-strand DNA-binding protein
MGKTINKVEIIGHVGSIEFREFSTGKEICNLSVPTKNSYKTKDGEWAEDTEWHRIVYAIPAVVERMKSIAKGDYVRCEGSIRTKVWKNKDGEDQTSREITGYQFDLLSRAAAKTDGGVTAPKVSSKKTQPDLDVDDDLPF